MDLTAWFGLQGVFSSGDAAHIFGSGPVLWSPPSALSALIRSANFFPSPEKKSPMTISNKSAMMRTTCVWV
jgi:hypothetical protein